MAMKHEVLMQEIWCPPCSDERMADLLRCCCCGLPAQGGEAVLALRCLGWRSKTVPLFQRLYCYDGHATL